jgi:hypothetical protein
VFLVETGETRPLSSLDLTELLDERNAFSVNFAEVAAP